MCGIVGGISGSAHRFNRSQISNMAERLSHRGPDSHGIWEKDGVILGHRRLAIVDLTVAGHQPMLSHNGRYALTYNGEIYNHLDIRAELARSDTINWRGHSDTETLVEALARWGIAKTLERLNGMFAFAFWDTLTRELILARDPFGEKPLLYGIKNDALVFASELSAIRTIPAFRTAPNPASVAIFLQADNVPAPLSIVEGIAKLPPGCFLEWKATEPPKLTSYWSVSDAVTKGRKIQLVDDTEALDELEALLLNAVQIRLMSDVPLGAFLSGGIDSSLVTALMQKSQSKPVRTFTIGFEDKEADESPHAAAVAAHLGTQHEVMVVSEQDALAAALRMGSLFDEPFADSSQIPTYLVSALARQHVTVALSGDGCDELFSGYARHTLAIKAWNGIARIPGRKWLAPRIKAIPDFILNATAQMLSPFVPAGVNPASLQKKIKYSGELLSADSADEVYQKYLSSWSNPQNLLRNGTSPAVRYLPTRPVFNNPYDGFVWQDSVDYLPNDILTKVDRASMAVSLETRIPALDRRVADFAWRLPQNMRWRDGRGKWALREILYRHVPKEIVDRPKKGFSVPLDKWLRGPLRDWSQDLLNSDIIRRQGLLNADVVAKKLELFNNRREVTASQIWTLVMFQSWMAANQP
jgi:asparagine synthase (glutamine-hydrolysing)